MLGMRPFKRKRRNLGIPDGPKFHEPVKRRCQNAAL